MDQELRMNKSLRHIINSTLALAFDNFTMSFW